MKFCFFSGLFIIDNENEIFLFLFLKKEKFILINQMTDRENTQPAI
jgi:hypothetical protein